MTDTPSTVPVLGGNPKAAFGAFFDANPEGMAWFGLDGRLVRANAAFLEQTGYSAEDMTGMTRQDLTPSQWHATDESILKERLLPQGHSGEYRKEYLRRDGSSLPVRVRAWLVRDPDGNPAGLIEATRAQEPRSQAEATRQSDPPFLRTLLETIPCPIFYKNAEGYYTGCNSAFEAYLGKPREQIIGTSVYDVAPKDLADIYHQRDLALFQVPGVQVYETQVKYADGSRHDVVFYKAAFRDAEGNAAGLVGVILDITSRKAAEQQLKDTLELNQKLLGAAPIGVGVYHASSGRCMTANAALERIANAPVDLLLSQNFRELESWKRSGLFAAAERALSSGEEQHLETEVTSTFGRHFWVSSVFTPFTSGEDRHLLVLMNDISEQQAAKAALQQSETRYRTLAENLGEGLAMTDVSFRYVYCNPSLLKILGCEEREVLGQSLPDFVAEKDREQVSRR